ncbi:MAG TPA: cytochrome c oxidase subunit 3 [Thermodesulfobacteriota bacterium]
MWEPTLRFQFEDRAKQAHAARLGMWVFLVSEMLLFGALFALYAAYRTTYPAAFAGATRLTDLTLGTANTYVLVTSSLVVALSLAAARRALGRLAGGLLALALAMGALFLVLKGVEYSAHFREGLYPGTYYRYAGMPDRGAQVFFSLYYLMTGLHALHVLIGMIVLAWLAWLALRGRFGPDGDTPLELGAMYWHFVDIIWLFLWPMFYLIH